MENTDIPNNKYENGKIYKITDNAYTEQYIGSTVQPLSSRIASHRKKYKEHKNGKYAYVSVFDLFDKYSLEHCKIELIEHYPCKDKEELRQREGYWIKLEECVNKCVAGRTKKEYREENKDEISKHKKEFYEENKDRINEQKKTNYHNKKDYYAEKMKLYAEKHREQISNQQKKYREEHKELRNSYLREKVECPHCHIMIGRTSLHRHIRNLHPETSK